MAFAASKIRADRWMTLIILTVLTAYFYVLMEWLFFATKPSFMSTLSLLDNLKILWIAPIPLVAVGIAWVLITWIPAGLIRIRPVRTPCYALGTVFPALILSLAVFLMIDNFTYTIFHFGVRSASGLSRIGYGLLLLVLFILSFRFLYKAGKAFVGSVFYRIAFRMVPLLIIISLVSAVAAYVFSGRTAQGPDHTDAPLKRRPNILIISSDGLNADNMSVYGYQRETTPFIGELASRALFCENSFTNAGTSAASIASMFTGKLPTRTRLIYYPDILKGKDAYQHLPGILKRHGYRNIEISVRHHTDPYDMNMRNSFHEANRRSVRERYVPGWSTVMLGQESSYFLGKMYDRAADRLLHAYGIREMVDPFAEVVKSGRKYTRDVARIMDLFSFIDASPSPFFAHIHLLGTHGPMFNPGKRLFSVGQKQEDRWMIDFYDDAVLSFDAQVEEIVGGLEERGILDNSVIIICTDHGQGWAYDLRLPLLFLFPGGKHVGRITANTQNIDVAPTLLEYLGVKKPEWMEGQSLISQAVDPGRLIFVVDRRHGLTGVGRRRQAGDAKVAPPFYTLGFVGIFYCHRLFMLDLDESTLTISDVKGHTVPCSEKDIPDPQEIGQMIIDHLIETGYDTASIKSPLVIRR
jgi:arylsulfatase A-like enzyme